MEDKKQQEALNFRQFEEGATDDIYYLQLLSQKGFYLKFQVTLRKTWNSELLLFYVEDRNKGIDYGN